MSRSARLGHKTAGGSDIEAARRSDCYHHLDANLTGHQYLWWKMRKHAPRQQILVIALTGVEAAKRPKMTEMQSRKDAAIAKIAISQYLWKEPVNQDIQLDCRHSTFPLHAGMGSIAQQIINN